VTAVADCHPTYSELEAALPQLERSPRERGKREVLDAGTLDVKEGLVGDRWATGKRRRVNQLTVINAGFLQVLARGRERWPLAGDQLYVDFDLSLSHVPAGTRIAIGGAEIEVSPEPHTGCRLFAERYGRDAQQFVGSDRGHALQLRGINAWVVRGGAVRVGDDVRALFD
jgi:MOSC domain-containing protein YiiM